MTPKEFDSRHIELFRGIKEIELAKAAIEDKEKKLKDDLLKAMEENNVFSIDNEFVKVTKVDETESVTFDSKRFKEDDPFTYDLYTKVSKRKAYIKITVKGDK